MIKYRQRLTFHGFTQKNVLKGPKEWGTNFEWRTNFEWPAPPPSCIYVKICLAYRRIFLKPTISHHPTLTLTRDMGHVIRLKFQPVFFLGGGEAFWMKKQSYQLYFFELSGLRVLLTSWRRACWLYFCILCHRVYFKKSLELHILGMLYEASRVWLGRGSKDVWLGGQRIFIYSIFNCTFEF